MNGDTTFELSHHREDVTVVVNYRDDTRSEDENPLNGNVLHLTSQFQRNTSRIT